MQFVMRLVLDGRASKILAFHKKHITHHLFPRTLEDFESLVGSQSLFEIVEVSGSKDKIVGICYIMEGEDPIDFSERYEFGGIFILPKFQGLGLATALGILSLSQYCVYDPPTGKIIAHVHENNEDPINLLTTRLGFALTGQETIPDEIAAKLSMEKNASGKVVGNLYDFNFSKLKDFADWLKNFDGKISGGKSKLEIDLRIWSDLDNAIKALREIAKDKSQEK